MKNLFLIANHKIHYLIQIDCVTHYSLCKYKLSRIIYQNDVTNDLDVTHIL